MPRKKKTAHPSESADPKGKQPRKPATPAQRQALEELRATLYSIGDAVISTDSAGRVTRMNRVAESLTGWSEAEALGLPLSRVFRIFNEATRAEVENPVERVLRDGAVVGLANHTVLVSRDGTERPIADSGAPIRSTEGETHGVVLVFRDQTEERRLENASARLASILEESVDYVGTSDVKGKLQYHNKAAKRMVGLPEDADLSAMKVADMHPEWAGRLIATEGIPGAIREGVWRGETAVLQRDGKEISVSQVIIAHKGPRGDVEYLSTIMRDISDQKRAEEDHKKHRDQLESLVQQRTQQLAESEQRLAKEISTVAAIVDEMLSGDLTDAEVEKQVLNACLDATRSVYGMIGVVNKHGKYDVTTYNGRTLGDCAFPEALAWKMTSGMEIRGIWGWPMIHGKPLLCNDLPAHPDRVGQPEGHVPIECYLGVPIKRDGKVIGMVAVANKSGGYTEADQQTLVRLVDVMVVSREYRELMTQLEERVRDRTTRN